MDIVKQLKNIILKGVLLTSGKNLNLLVDEFFDKFITLNTYNKKRIVEFLLFNDNNNDNIFSEFFKTIVCDIEIKNIITTTYNNGDFKVKDKIYYDGKDIGCWVKYLKIEYFKVDDEKNLNKKNCKKFKINQYFQIINRDNYYVFDKNDNKYYIYDVEEIPDKELRKYKIDILLKNKLNE